MQPDPSAPARNRLSLETSPYLLQHADNPVNWQPWDANALAAAKAQDRPILLSIGYSACHWCHVMAHESFENPAIAQVMNDLFINIKVDREERPDLEKIYQIAQQMITQRSGGWPLTMFLNPEDQSPFFGGTYFPDVARHGMPAFPDLLRRVAEYFRANREQIRAQKGQIEAAGRCVDFIRAHLWQNGRLLAAYKDGRARFNAYLDAAERTLMAAWPALHRSPQGHVSLITALEDFLHSNQIVIIRGEAQESQRWAQQLSRVYAPRRLLFAIPIDAADLPAALADKAARGATTAYICTGMTCSAPINDLDELARALQRSAT